MHNPNSLIEAIIDESTSIEVYSGKRNYLSPSILSEPCLRKIQYKMQGGHEVPPIQGKSVRAIDIGYFMEEKLIEYMQKSGFVFDKLADGKQHSFKILDDRYGGKCDGIITASPTSLIDTPCIAEFKALSDDRFNTVRQKGVEEAFPGYYEQVISYQKAFKLTENPALFVAVNRATLEIYFELIEFNQEIFDKIENKVNFIYDELGKGNNLPKISCNKVSTCNYCPYKDLCWDNEPEKEQEEWF
jgi:hypothetical protein